MSRNLNLSTESSMGSLLYAFAWFLFALVHSLLARPSLQEKFESHVKSWYRLLYNLLALISVAIVLVAGRSWLSDNRFAMFDNQLVEIFSLVVQLLGLVVLVLAFASYDKGRFIGITQVITGERVSSATNEPLQRSGLNRWMRHPLYTGAFLVLWGGAISLLGFWTAIWGTLYLVIGSRFEERKLINIYGDDYRRYQQDVPQFFPRLKKV